MPRLLDSGPVEAAFVVEQWLKKTDPPSIPCSVQKLHAYKTLFMFIIKRVRR